ncbi:hypothetical protein INT43_004069 [Umbelopsis isabellina]|uniref:Uncharacterized protein n=1 Tax=Mortierella isabellina TaxID=91625 RepID=A0A8H7PUR8_MORIS|nr:hypothetical protein INT43_004069 [Umbelopsis isabellina]
MQYKKLLLLFSVYFISCCILLVSAFSFDFSEKKDVEAQAIVKCGGDTDDELHKHEQQDNDYEHHLDYAHAHDHGCGYKDHGDDDNNDSNYISRASVSILVDGKTYRIPCGAGDFDISQICSDACGNDVTASETATLVYENGTGTIVSIIAYGTGTNIIPLQYICEQKSDSCGVKCSPNQNCINACPTGQHCALSNNVTIYQCVYDNIPNSCGVRDPCLRCPVIKIGEATCVCINSVFTTVPDCYESFNWNGDFFVDDENYASPPNNVINKFRGSSYISRNKPFNMISVFLGNPPFGAKKAITTFTAILKGRQVGAPVIATQNGAVYTFPAQSQNIHLLQITPVGESQFFALDDFTV